VWRLAILALVPATAFAKPAFYRPRETVDSEALAAAATTKLAVAIRAKNVGAISDVLGAKFTNNGMWFPDAACAKRFERSGEISGAERAVFARCLAGLKLQMTTRKPAARDGGLLTADPGIEIELAFQGDSLRWIGFPSQSGADRALPMLTAQTFEALRTQGTTVVDAKVAQTLDLEIAQQRALVATAWLKVCLDPEGEVAKLVTIQSSSSVAASAFMAAAADWKFKPFTVRGTPMAACSVSLLVYPGSRAPLVEQYPNTVAPSGPITRTYEFDDDDFEIMGGIVGGQLGAPPPPPTALNVAPTMIENLRVAGNKQIFPDAPTRGTILQSGRTKVVATMKMCLDDKGSVSSVTQLKSSGFPAYDRKIISEMRQWLYRPYKHNGRAVPVCTAVTFIFDAAKQP